MKVSPNTYITLIALIAILAFGSCKNKQYINNENFSSLYTEDEKNLASDIVIKHINDSLSRVSMNINSNELLYVRENSNAPFFADIRISLIAFNYLNEKEILDTTMSSFHIAKDSITSDFLAYTIDIDINTGEQSFLRIDITDINKSRKETHTALINKKSPYASQWFGIMEESEAHFTYSSYSAGDTVVLNYLGKDKDALKIHFYTDSFDIPNPPFSFENLKPFKLEPDSIFSPLSIDDTRLTFITKEKGLYFISADPEEKYGYTVFCTKDYYPLVAKASDMIPPTRYICSKKEFRTMLANPNAKDAIDNFWLSIGDYEKRASMLIKKYYSRVIEANRLFTAHTEGWKSDRGMIYIVFGVPNIVYRDKSSEIWIYGEDKNFFSITLTFKLVENKFSSNDYFLIRTPIYKDNWYRAVDLWRQ